MFCVDAPENRQYLLTSDASKEQSDTGSMTGTDAQSGMDADAGSAMESDASTGTTAQGLKSLYMGHSYFRRQAEAMQEYADRGIEGHESTSIFYGGYKGSAAAIWANESASNSQDTIKGHLDAGDIEMFGMTIFVDLEAPEGDIRHVDRQIQGLKNWIEYARSKNPSTIFFVAQPWLGRPLEYVGNTGDPQTSGHEEYRARILMAENGMTGLMDELRATFDDSEIFLLAYGQGSVELRTLYNTGNLPDVDTLVSHDGLLGIHRDEHGHAEQLLTDLNTLIWLKSIYNYDVLQFEREYPYSTDIKQIAHDVTNRQNPAYTRQFD